ncbi:MULTISPECIES: LmbU family transcriptional regulator [unclassified Pseudonocardia]|uniref:LmbU family transcriptional regulator n=1 Tax=unclassified Pseudonocardia TaxID=2619320 RepID=UPI000A931583|nr:MULTISPECIES: LmbU family transcriptional regulator [unclassified Pseudonocardia]
MTKNDTPGAALDALARCSSQPNKVLLTRVGLTLPDDLDLAEWERAGMQIQHIIDSSTWCLGDWLIFGREHFPGRYRHAIDAVGLKYQTLRNYAWVAQRYTVERRHAALTFQHHAEVASLRDPEQDHWLREAARNGWSTKQLRAALRNAIENDPSGRNPSGVVLPRFRIDEGRLTQWRSAAEQADMSFDAWVIAALDVAADQPRADQPVSDPLSLPG